MDVERVLTFHPPSEEPTETGWYECRAVDDRWKGETRYRAWGNGYWWIPLPDGWITAQSGIYHWRGPVADVNGPAPDGSDPRTDTDIEGVSDDRC